jgi:hypothetical protein
MPALTNRQLKLKPRISLDLKNIVANNKPLYARLENINFASHEIEVPIKNNYKLDKYHLVDYQNKNLHNLILNKIKTSNRNGNLNFSY